MPPSRSEIGNRLRRPTNDPSALVITPLLWPADSIDEDSVDLRLGGDFLIARSDRLAAHVPGYAGSEYQRPVHVPLGRYLVLPGHQTVLASTLEFLRLPPNLSAMVLTKSSWARTFISVESAPWVHPLFRGCLTLEIANASETPIVLHPGLAIAQLTFFAVKTTQVKDRLSGSYVGPIKPEPAQMKPPESTLASELGIRPGHVRRPWDEFYADETRALVTENTRLKTELEKLRQNHQQ